MNIMDSERMDIQQTCQSTPSGNIGTQYSTTGHAIT